MNPDPVQVDIQILLRIIGELYVENWARKQENVRRSDNTAPTAASTNGAGISPAVTGQVSRGE